MIDMDFEGEHDHEELYASPKHVIVQELEVNTSPPILGSDNSELGTEALTRMVREVLKEVFKARIRETSEKL
ncbi:hypothetical protein J1N35_037820 [Gossypium stocksii]|uniref:Uncharacterized protein n=1 Tax=Gossypium stocksii TaxID=47602 RepID=A0A9D3UKT5_9ROSI|nr:hypothetical protein J1N35_037820 [Gossypium stocksii]